MSAATLIRRVRAAGGEIALAADGIRLKAPVSLRNEVIAEIRANKDAIRLALKTEGCAPWDADDYRAFYNERAGIAHFDGGLSRPEAEARAFASCVAEWLNRNAVQSPPGRCHGCGRGEHTNEPLLPFGTEYAGHVWLHSDCWSAWHARRKAEAVTALAAVGISSDVQSPV